MFLSKNLKKDMTKLSNDQKVAYFCAEYGISDILPIYSGGLGILAGDMVQEAARQKLPFVAVGLFYKKGYFHQHLTEHGQEESTQEIRPDQVPLTLLTDQKGETLLIQVPIHERIVFAQVWRFAVGENNLYLLDTDHWKNSESDRAITDQLYSGDQIKRIQQELVLGVGGQRTLQALGIAPSLYHMNEGHSAFLALELMAGYLLESGTPHPLEDVIRMVKKRLVFTNHTLVAAGNDLFPHELIRYWLGSYAFNSRLGIETILNLGVLDGKPGYFSMTMMAMRMSARSNAVSKLHGQKAQQLWPEFHLQFVTNGVHLPAWLAQAWQNTWDTEMPGWRDTVSDAQTWKKVRSLPSATIWNTHQELKGRMLDEVYARTGIRLEDDVLTIVWARRFATYKRPDLLFADLERLKKILFNTDRPVQVVIAGKSHPADGQGKDIIQHIENLANFELKHRAIFVDDYSISLAKVLVSGADIWLNTPIFGLEASGTSGMKAGANGVLQCTVSDGWAYEVDWNGRGFALPAENTETELYNILEKKIVPLFYNKSVAGIPEQWVAMMKESISTISPKFSSTRMVNEYVESIYLPTIQG